MLIRDTKAIKTFFELFDRPLSAAELAWYRKAFSCEDVFLYKEELQPQREYNELFQKRYRESAKKWRRAKRVAGVLKMFPWVQGVAIANTLSFLNVREESDIDLFVLTKRNRVWLSRLSVAGLLRLLRLRPGEAKYNPVCPSFFVSEDSFDFSTIALNGGDSYLQFWLATLNPAWDSNKSFEKFFASNRWGTERMHKSSPLILGFGTRVMRGILKILDFSWMESLAKRFQMRLLPGNLKKMALDVYSTSVVINSGMLKFHQNDRRAHYHRLWKEAYEKTD